MSTLKVLADVIAQGFRGLSEEMRQARLKREEFEERIERGVGEYLKSLEDRDKRYYLEHADFKARLEEVERKVAPQ